MVMAETGKSYPTFFNSLSEAQKKELEAVGVVKRFRKGEALFMPGDDSECATIIRKGLVKATFIALEGKEITLPLMRPGQLFGISSFLDWGQRVCFATALNDVEVLCIPGKDMKVFINSHIDVAMLIINYLGTRLRGSWKIIEDLMSKTVRERVIRMLFMLYKDFGRKDGNTVVIDINLTHEQLAQMTGTSRQTATTILRELENAKAIIKERKRIVVCDSAIFDDLE
jgi:CRP/FNR family transcriptional regulator, cyclic AMP receptor protein